MKTLQPRSTRPMKHKHGFALLVTMMLLALLLLITVGLLSMSTITLRQSGTGAAQAEAQANAKMALLLAIAELQKYAGPDQRVTARADIQEPLGNANSGALKQPWLMGVWKAEDHPQSNQLGRDLRLKRAQKLPAYLISGNERFDLSAGSAGGSYPTGYVTPDQSLPSNSGNRPGQVEIGRFSRDGQAQVVSAPLVKVAGAKGLDGGYAYWVEDEGVKARLDLTNPFDQPSGQEETHAAAALGQRNRVDWIAKGSQADQPGTSLESLPKAGDDPLYKKLVSLNTVALSGGNANASRDDLKRLCSDLTTNSRSLLVDMQRGGFRRDLTAAFRPNGPSLQSQVGQGRTFDTELIFPQQGSPNDGETGNNLIYRPGGAPWSVLKDYAGYASRVGSKSQVLDVRDWLGNLPVQGAATPTYNARDLRGVSQLYPVLNRVQMLFDVSYENAGGGNYDVMFHLFPSIVLWNPYDQPLRVPRFRVDIPARISWSSGTDRVQELGFEYRLQPGTFTYVGTPPAGNPKAVFALRFYSGRDFEIPAGKAIILTTPARHIQYNAGAAAGQELVPAWQDGFGLFVRGQRIRFNNPAVAPRVDIAWTDADANPTNQTNDFGGETRILSQELGFQLVRCNWNIDGTATQPNAPPFISFTPRIRTAAQPLTSASPKWGGVLARKCIDNQLQPMVAAGSPNAYPAKSLAAYNLRAHHSTHVGDSLMGPVQFISGNVTPAPLGNLASYVKPQIANAATAGGPHYAFVGGSDQRGTDKSIMFHIPRDNEPMLSLAQFSHANLGRPLNIDIHRSSSVGEDLEPTYPIGNSIRPPHHPADQLKAFTTGQWDWSVAYQGQARNVGSIYRADSSFLYNNALWDSYYLSGYDKNAKKFLNARLKLDAEDATTAAAMENPVQALSKVYLDGGFNVNSTSKAAWKALLASTVGIRDSGAGTASKPGYNRISQPNSPFTTLNSGDTAGSASSYTNDARMLDEASLDLLAEQIVQQVKLRGPFPTLSAFVNRSVDPASHVRSGLTQNQVCNQGALQAALDGTSATKDVNQNISRSDWVTASQIVPAWSNASQPGRVFAEAAEGARGFGAPFYLMPSDILAKIGPFLTVRSDTFKITTYGESRDASGKVLARARCEAIVQRVPQWIGSQLAATDMPQPGSPEERFGRSLHMVSFRWLNDEKS